MCAIAEVIVMGCFSGKAKQDKSKQQEPEKKDPLAIVPPSGKQSNFTVTVVKADGSVEPYVPRPKPEPKQYDKNAHITLSIEDLRGQAFKVSGTPNLRISKLYDQVKSQLGSNPKEFLLIYNGKDLVGDEKVLGEYEVTTDATISLVYTVKAA